MRTITTSDLESGKCVPCEGGVQRWTPYEAEAQLAHLPGWRLTSDARRIRRDWVMKDFMAAIDFFKRVAQLAERKGHHPDLHLEGYRNVWIELSTHAIGGLSQNDFVLAAKIDRIPVRLKRP